MSRFSFFLPPPSYKTARAQSPKYVPRALALAVMTH